MKPRVGFISHAFLLLQHSSFVAVMYALYLSTLGLAQLVENSGGNSSPPEPAGGGAASATSSVLPMTSYTPAPTLQWKAEGEEDEGWTVSPAIVLLIVLPICIIVLIIVIIKYCSAGDIKPIDGTGHRARNAQARQALERDRWERADASEQAHATSAAAANQRWSFGKLTHRAAARALRLVSFLGLSGNKTTSESHPPNGEASSGEEMRPAAPLPNDSHSVAISVSPPPSILISSQRSCRSGSTSLPVSNTADNKRMSLSNCRKFTDDKENEDIGSSPEEQERTPLIPAEVTAIRAFSPAVSVSASLSNSLRRRHKGGVMNHNLSVSEEQSPLCINPFRPVPPARRNDPRSKEGESSEVLVAAPPSYGFHLHPSDSPTPPGSTTKVSKQMGPHYTDPGGSHHHQMGDSLQLNSYSTEIGHY